MHAGTCTGQCFCSALNDHCSLFRYKRETMLLLTFTSSLPPAVYSYVVVEQQDEGLVLIVTA